jgi:hypothetical protein
VLGRGDIEQLLETEKWSRPIEEPKIKLRSAGAMNPDAIRGSNQRGRPCRRD